MKKLLLLTLSLLVMSSAVTAAKVAGERKVKPQLRLERTDALSPRAPVPDEAGQHDFDEPVSFTGTWKTIAGGSNPYTVILKQIGAKVSGTYSPGNGKIFDGVVTDRKLTFKWTQDGGYEGTAEFMMDEDGKGFTGSSTALKPKEFSVTWNTVKPLVASFAGVWDTISTGQYPIQLTMVQTGDKVTGMIPARRTTNFTSKMLRSQAIR